MSGINAILAYREPKIACAIYSIRILTPSSDFGLSYVSNSNMQFKRG